MQAAGRRTMPRLAVGVRPSASFYAPAVPHGLRLCGGGFGGHAFYHLWRAPQGALVFHSLRQFFPDVHIDSFAPHRPPARGHGGGAVFSRRERTIAHGHARTARFGGASGHSRGRICPAPRRGFATAAPSGGGLRVFPRPRPADSSGCGVAHGASSGRLGSVARCLPFVWGRAWRRSTA